jgi:hypothetical protein
LPVLVFDLADGVDVFAAKLKPCDGAAAPAVAAGVAPPKLNAAGAAAAAGVAPAAGVADGVVAPAPKLNPPAAGAAVAPAIATRLGSEGRYRSHWCCTALPGVAGAPPPKLKPCWVGIVL